MDSRDKLNVGVDMDGVIARHDFRGTWIRLRKLKENLFKKTKLYNYYYPSSIFEKIAWIEINKRRTPFIDENNIFRSLANQNKIHFYLVTGRFKFLEQLTIDWLKKYNCYNYFKKILINIEDIDPRIFKSKVIKSLKLAYFIDDDLETIRYLRKKTKAELFWIVPDYQDRKGSQINSYKDFNEALKQLDKIIKK